MIHRALRRVMHPAVFRPVRRVTGLLPRGWPLRLAVFFYIVVAVWGAINYDPRQLELLVCIYAMLYGAWRPLAFHPRFRPTYRDWLADMPWMPGRPLPLGPVHLVAGDLVILALLGLPLLVWRPLYSHLGLQSVFLFLKILLFSYLAAAIVLLFGTRQNRFGFAMLFGMLLALHVSWMPNLVLIICVGLYGVANIGLRRGLANYPWGQPRLVSDSYRFDPVLPGTLIRFARGRQTAAQADISDLPGIRLIKTLFPKQRRPEMEIVGPVLENLCPVDRRPRVRLETGFCLAALCGCAAYVITTFFEEPQNQIGVAGTYGILAGIVNFFLTVQLLRFHKAHVGILQRIASIVFFVPSYDRMWVLSLVGLVLALVLPLAIFDWNNSIPAALGISSFLYVLHLTLALPQPAPWRLTGPRQIIVPDRRKAESDPTKGEADPFIILLYLAAVASIYYLFIKYYPITERLLMDFRGG